MKQVLLVQPAYGGMDPESYHAAQMATARKGDVKVGVMRPVASLLAHAFNIGAVKCLNDRYQYFAMLHGDVAAEEGWLDTMMDVIDSGVCDVLHRVLPIKDGRRLTSTAVAYCDDEWYPVRRLTIKECNRKLPETFTLTDVREHVDADATRLLPNTGCMVFRADTWFRDFSGFTINDRIDTLDGEEWSVDVTPEDWNFGHWCARHDVTVGATRAFPIKHFGRAGYSDDDSEVGWDADETYMEQIANMKGVCDAI